MKNKKENVKKWKDKINEFTNSNYYPIFIKKCKEFVKKYSDEIIVEKSDKYEEVVEK